MDVKSAFLNGVLDEEIYMEQPQGFIMPGTETKVCRLKRAIYGLKQASHTWNIQFHGFLTGIGFTQTHADAGVYVDHQQQRDGPLIIILYVTIPAITPTFSSPSRPTASPEVPRDISSSHVPLGSHMIHL